LVLGKLSVDNALQRAYGMGIASAPYEELDNEATDSFKKGEIYNFGVYRYSKNNKSTKCVIQIDFQEESIALLQRGQKLKSFPFRTLKAVIDSDDSPRIQIQFVDLNEIDIDAGTLEEKNQISRIILLIIGQIQTGFPVLSEDIVTSKRKEPIKEGVIEKKGHSAAFLMWPKRFIRLLPGEMIYFRVGEENNESSALSIISLLPDETHVRKMDDNGFVLETPQKEYAFRVSSAKSEQIERERNDWIIALQTAIRGSIDAEPIQQSPTKINALHQEDYLKSIAKSLKDELEQLGVMLNIIDAPIRASAQVKKVREIVESLNNQIHTGLLSWTLRHTRNQRLSIAADDDDDNFDPQNYVNHQAVTTSKGDSYSRHHITSRFANAAESEGPSRGSTLILPTNQAELQHITQQLNTLDAAQQQQQQQDDQPKYPNYRPPSPVGSDEDGESYVQYRPAYSPPTRNSGGYAIVNKKSMKQKKENLYVNLDRRYDDLCTWSEQAPPIPPRPEDEELASSVLEESSVEVVVVEEGKGETLKEKTEVVSSSGIPSPPPLSGNVPAPPPLPGVNALPKKPDLHPNCKLKPLFWSKVPDAQISTTMWKNASDRLDKIDITKIEDLFNLSKGIDQSKVLDEIDKSSKEGKSLKSLLEPKKAQNLGIFLSGFKLDVTDLDSKLSKLEDENGLTSEEIHALKRFQPTPEEVEMYKGYKGDIEKLPNVDKFVYKMCDMKNLNSRLDILLTIREIPDQIEGIEPPIGNLINACKTLKDNTSFQRLLEYVLSIGNYMNGGTNRGCAYGFRLSALVKLVDIRSADKKQTLLQFLAEELFQKDNEALMCYKEMDALLIPMDISVKGLMAEVDIMIKDVETLNRHVVKLSSGFDQCFIDKINEFIKTYSNKLLALHKQCSEIVRLASDLKKMYGESQSSDFENWLHYVSDFLKQLRRAAEAAEQKQRRLTNRKKNLEKVIGEMAIKGLTTDPLQTNTIPRVGHSIKERDIRESYEKIVTHSTRVPATTKEPILAAPVSFSFGNATVLQLQPAESIEELSFPTKTGWLDKLSGGKRRNQKWDSRFFELTSTGYLHYSKQENGKLSGAVYLRGSPVKIDEKDPCIIGIHHEERLWRLRGDNELEVSDWFNALSYYARMETSTDDEL